MRVLAITNLYPTPDRLWFGTFVEQQVASLRRAGVETRVVYFNRKTEGPLVYYRMKPAIAQAIAEFSPDLLHVMYGGVMAGKVMEQGWRIPAIVTFHGSDLLGENLSGLKRKLISRYGVGRSWQAAREADGVVVVARHLERTLPPQVDRAKVRIIPCGIDLARFKPMDPAECRRRLGWKLDAFHVLFPANTGDPVKRPALAKVAIQAAQRNGVPAELHALSGVPYADVPVWINASDVLILTSLHEGSPMVIKEALACQVPVVSVDVGDVAERLEGIEGCHIVGNKPEEIAVGLMKVWKRSGRLEGVNIAETLSLEAIARRLIQFYTEVLNRSGNRVEMQKVSVEQASFAVEGRS